MTETNLFSQKKKFAAPQSGFFFITFLIKSIPTPILKSFLLLLFVNNMTLVDNGIGVFTLIDLIIVHSVYLDLKCVDVPFNKPI